MRRIFMGIGVSAIVIAVLAGGYRYTMSRGKEALIEVAREYDMCWTADCPEGVTALVEMLLAADPRYRSRGQIEWCLGVDKWATTHVRKGAWIKDILLWAMYYPCNIPQDDFQTSVP